MEREEYFTVVIEADNDDDDDDAAKRYARALTPGINPQQHDAYMVEVLEDGRDGWEKTVEDETGCILETDL
jgi:hypothetical protein